MLSFNRTGTKHAFFFVAVFLTLIFTRVSAQANTVKVASLIPEGHPTITFMRATFTKISRLSGGEITFKLYAGGVAGDEVDVIRKMRINRIQMSMLTGLGVGHIAPNLRVAEALGLFRNYDEIDFIRSRLYEEFAAEFRKNGYVLLGWGDIGFLYIYSKHNLLEARDFKKFNMWVWKGDPEQAAYFDNLGFSTVPLHLADVVTGLETNMIDTCFGTPTVATAFQWYAQLKYGLDILITNPMIVMLINEKTFEQLSPETQKIFKDETQRMFNEANVALRRMDSEANDVLQNAGVRILKPTPELVAHFEKQARVTTSGSIARGLFSQEEFDRIQGLLQEYRARQN